jgi:hypothetical protein
MWSLAAVAGGVAGYTAIQKSQAQDNAKRTADSIVNAATIEHIPQQIDCSNLSNLTMMQQQQFAGPCSDYNTDNNDVNLDATVANVAIGVGAGLVVGGFLYWWFASKGPVPVHEVGQTPAPLPVVVPVIGHKYGALSATWQF